MKEQFPFDFSVKALIEGGVQIWGIKKKALKAAEECAELVIELTRFAADHPQATSERMQDEIADVLLMAMQMRLHFGADKIDDRIRYKIERTGTAMENYKAKARQQKELHAKTWVTNTKARVATVRIPKEMKLDEQYIDGYHANVNIFDPSHRQQLQKEFHSKERKQTKTKKRKK